MTKRICLFLSACLITQLSFAQVANKRDTSLSKVKPSATQFADRIVAVVNEDIITLNELNERKRVVLRQLEKQGTPLPSDDVLSRQVLDRMIVDKAQIQLAKETGIKVDDTQLDRTMQRIADDSKMSMTELRSAIEKDGANYQTFREDIRNEILLNRLREREVENNITVTDSEVETELANESANKAQESEYRLQHILIAIPDQTTPQQVASKRNRAELAAAAIQRGTDFGQVAATYSEAPDALSGGNLGWRTPSRLPSLFVELLSKMKPGDISPILKSPNGLHIFKLAEQRSRQGAELINQTHARHILLKSKESVSDADLRQRLETLRARIAEGTDFAELAKLQSEDGSAANGGDLGWIAPGETVPQFERAMNDLKPGEISGPVQSPFGWHLIQVIDRRQGELSGDKQKLAVRQAIKSRKADDAYQDWLQQLRDKAFIDNRLEEK